MSAPWTCWLTTRYHHLGIADPVQRGTEESFHVVMVSSGWSGIVVATEAGAEQLMQPEPMTTESTLREDMDKAFVTAFLLSGNAARAEAAVLQGIESMNSDRGKPEDLLQTTVEAAIERETFGERSLTPPGPALTRLPLELQRVMRLPHFLRQCFVLRVLAGLPRELCADLLNSDQGQVDRGTCAAMLELPSIRDNRFATYSGWDGSNN